LGHLGIEFMVDIVERHVVSSSFSSVLASADRARKTT